MSERIITQTKVSIHKRGTCPLSDEGAISVEVRDEGGGPFLVIKSAECEKGLRIDLDELELAAKAAKSLVAEFTKAAEAGKGEQ